jgi:hypothetical protein
MKNKSSTAECTSVTERSEIQMNTKHKSGLVKLTGVITNYIEFNLSEKQCRSGQVDQGPTQAQRPRRAGHLLLSLLMASQQLVKLTDAIAICKDFWERLKPRNFLGHGRRLYRY